MSDRDLEAAADAIAAAKHVAVLTGAGVSAESGIPTFRGIGGLWRGRDPMSLATPEAFAADPVLVWSFYSWRRGIVAGAHPNPAHTSLVEMAKLVPRLSLITQNVDRLHQAAGSSDVVELHGNLQEIRCARCGRTEDPGWEELPTLPTCGDCGALMRPAVVWFGESLPTEAMDAAVDAVMVSDVFVVIGTSAVVYPAAGLIARPGRRHRTIVEVNVEPTAASHLATIRLYGQAGKIMPSLVESVRSRGDSARRAT